MDLNRPIILYMHAGSGNHGCEAIANSTVKLIERLRKGQNADTNLPVIIASNSVLEDRKYSLLELENKGLCTLVEDKHIDRDFLPHVFYYVYRKLTGDRESFLRYKYRDVFKAYDKAIKEENVRRSLSGKKPLAVSIGGDNYCYPEMVEDLILAHNVFRKKGFETVLWGCSIEPDSLKDKRLIDDLNSYEKIYTRESITYNGLVSAGISKNKLELRKDPAFELETVREVSKDGFIPGKTVGINLSPMVQNKEKVAGITMENYCRLISYIIENTDENVALIPHVVWANNDDRKPLRDLYDRFKSTKRVVIIDDASCEELKGFISKCSFFVGARTHSTIAAYSSKVPTLVIGYSVKSRGIATDLFGDYSNYVLPVQELTGPDEMVKAYKWLKDNYKEKE